MTLNSNLIALFLVSSCAALTPSVAQTISSNLIHETKATDEQINNDIRSLEIEIQKNTAIEGLKAQAQTREDHLNDDRVLAETISLTNKGVKPVRYRTLLIEPVKAPTKVKRNTHTSWISTDREAGKAAKSNDTLH